MDPTWLKNLARAALVEGRWQLDDEGITLDQAAYTLLDMIPTLCEEAKRGAEVFNMHARGKSIKVLPAQAKDKNGLVGFALLFGVAQLKVEQEGHAIKVTLIAMRHYRRVEKLLYTLQPEVDEFGSLTWFIAGNGPYTNEVILRRLFRDLCEAAYQSTSF